MYNTTECTLGVFLVPNFVRRFREYIGLKGGNFMNNIDIDRINELYHKSKSVGLTKAEEAEQKNSAKLTLLPSAKTCVVL